MQRLVNYDDVVLTIENTSSHNFDVHLEDDNKSTHLDKDDIDKIIDLFNNYKRKYYQPGYFVMDVLDGQVKGGHYKMMHIHTHVMCDCMGLSYQFNDKEIKGGLIGRAGDPIHRSEYETLFGFGGHCKGHYPDKHIYLFPKFGRNINDVFENVLEDAKVDNELIKFLGWYTLHSGCINSTKGANELLDEICNHLKVLHTDVRDYLEFEVNR